MKHTQNKTVSTILWASLFALGLFMVGYTFGKDMVTLF